MNYQHFFHPSLLCSNSTNPWVPMSPYALCSPQECQERQASGEISPWEQIPHRLRHGDRSDAPTAKPTLPPRHGSRSAARELDPCLAVTKYRRSAAGLTRENRPPPRTMHQLEATVTYLTLLLTASDDDEQEDVVDDSPHPDDSRPEVNRSSSLHTWRSKVEFVEDRLRAIQVELVMTERSAPSLQCSMARLQILIIYFSSTSTNEPSRVSTPSAGRAPVAYSVRLGQEALQTSLTNYWHLDRDGIEPMEARDNPEEKDHHIKDQVDQDFARDDEMLSYWILCDLQRQLERQQHYGVGPGEDPSGNDERAGHQVTGGAGMSFYRQHVPVRLGRGKRPCFQWSLHLVAAVHLGHWWKTLSLLEAGPSIRETGPDQSEQPIATNQHDNEPLKRNKRFPYFALLARCCLSPSLPYLRWKALESYNHSFMKSEALSLDEVGRLLFITSSEITSPPLGLSSANINKSQLQYVARVAELCHRAGLPSHEDGSGSVLFKVRPIQAWDEEELGRRDDDFVWKNYPIVKGATKCDVPLSLVRYILLPG